MRPLLKLPTFTSTAYRNIFVASLSYGVFTIGASLFWAAIPILATHVFGLGVATAGAMMAAIGIVYILFDAPLGIALDYIGYKRGAVIATILATIPAMFSIINPSLPLFFIGGLIDIADTASSIRKRQDSPYAYDPYNRITPGFGLGFKWNLDIWKVNANIEKEKAEYFKLIHQKELAEQGIPTEVKKAYLEYQEAMNVISHAKEEQEQTKKWFMQSVFAWGFGVGDSREVLESVIFKGFSDKNYYESLYNHNVAISSLTRSTGTELLSYLKY